VPAILSKTLHQSRPAGFAGFAPNPVLMATPLVQIAYHHQKAPQCQGTLPTRLRLQKQKHSPGYKAKCAFQTYARMPPAKPEALIGKGGALSLAAVTGAQADWGGQDDLSVYRNLGQI
jgi:hypothetical protein